MREQEQSVKTDRPAPFGVPFVESFESLPSFNSKPRSPFAKPYVEH